MSISLSKAPNADRVRCVWEMSHRVRTQLWTHLQSHLQMEELELGGENAPDGTKCPLDCEEAAILSPQGSLRQLRTLHLSHIPVLTDFGWIVDAECGPRLESLCLWGMLFD